MYDFIGKIEFVAIEVTFAAVKSRIKMIAFYVTDVVHDLAFSEHVRRPLNLIISFDFLNPDIQYTNLRLL